MGRPSLQPFPANVIRNQKYSVLSFIPLVLFNQFKFFLNLYFLVMACSQFVPVLRIGYLYTYWGPLGFVISVTMVREAIDDIRRWQRDREVNSAKYAKLTERGRVLVTASKLQVGDVVEVDGFNFDGDPQGKIVFVVAPKALPLSPENPDPAPVLVYRP